MHVSLHTEHFSLIVDEMGRDIAFLNPLRLSFLIQSQAWPTNKMTMRRIRDTLKPDHSRLTHKEST
jgi:hypothetical protein